jgi:hypothetical protein
MAYFKAISWQLPEERYEEVQSDQQTSKLRFKTGTSQTRKWGTPNSRVMCGESAVNTVIMEIICTELCLLLCHTLIPSFFSTLFTHYHIQ